MYDPNSLFTDPILTSFSVGYRDQTLQGMTLCPVTPVSQRTGRYRVFDRSDWLIYSSRREPGTVANEVGGRKWSQDTYYVQEHSLQSPVFDEERQLLTGMGGLADASFGGALQIDPEKDAVKNIVRSIQLEHELKVATAYRNTANYAVTNTVTLLTADQWDNYDGATSDPVAVIRAAILAIFAQTGVYPNLLALPIEGFSYLENHPVIVDRFKNFNLTDPEAFRKLTGFTGKIVPLVAKYNTADNVDAAESIVSVWGEDVFLGIINETPGILEQTYAKTFALPYADGSLTPIDRWREEPRKADIFRASMNYEIKIVSEIAGFLIKEAFATTSW